MSFSQQGKHSPVITGIGMIHPTTVALEGFWTSIISGIPRFQIISRFDPSQFDCQIGGQINDESLVRAIDPRRQRTCTHATQLALAASLSAGRHARLDQIDSTKLPIGVCIGTTLGGWVQAEQQHAVFLDKGALRVNPFLAAGAPQYSASIEVASALGARGPNFTFSSGCSASIHAIAHASDLVRHGQVKYCVSGGTESPLSPVIIASLSRSNELSRQKHAPNLASRPFDRNHDGIVPSEGACSLVIEAAEHAADRGATVLAEVLGSRTSCDGRGLFQSDPSSQTAASALQDLLLSAGIGPEDIDYVCAHANSSPAFDRKEALVLKRAFGEFAAKIPVSSIKGVLGHPFGASGAFQTAAAALAMQHGLIPPTHNLEDPDPECDLDLVIGEPRPATIRHALITSYGYGGVNAYLLLRNPNL